MPLFSSLLCMAALVALASLAGVAGSGQWLFLTVIPYASFAIFIGGLSWRVVSWARSPVPFRIPTTCGQQQSLPWIKSARLDNPATGIGAVGRMLLEVLLFRSLFRNNRAEIHDQRCHFGDSSWLWLGALSFHWSLLVISLRHLRLFIEPVPRFVLAIDKVDSFFQVGTPPFYLSNAFFFCGLTYLLLRRLRDHQLRYISQFSDYFAMFLLLSIAVSGMIMRYWIKVDVVAVKRLAIGLATFQPLAPDGLGPVFTLHLLLICALAIYFPFSKLMHLGGVFLSPTRNLANNSRMRRHINPWNHPVKTHSYAEWEAEFRDKLTNADIPLDEARHDG